MIIAQVQQTFEENFRLTLLLTKDSRVASRDEIFSPRAIAGAVGYIDAIYRSIEDRIVDVFLAHEVITEEQAAHVKRILQEEFALQHCIVTVEVGSLNIRSAISGALLFVLGTVCGSGLENSHIGKRVSEAITEIIDSSESFIRSSAARVYVESGGGNRFGILPSRIEKVGTGKGDWLIKGAACDVFSIAIDESTLVSDSAINQSLKKEASVWDPVEDTVSVKNEAEQTATQNKASGSKRVPRSRPGRRNLQLD